MKQPSCTTETGELLAFGYAYGLTVKRLRRYGFQPGIEEDIVTSTDPACGRLRSDLMVRCLLSDYDVAPDRTGHRRARGLETHYT
ncbi:hypothetical protein [Paraburkholderia hospita]|uniref:hypothetical protein n=1 Tax=Paraburkholderia hospita TaxID=169430 RepID=UPI001054BC26|nr:hypothetical protein [Paraburkholderia hospita]